LNLRPLGPESGSGDFSPTHTHTHEAAKSLALLGMSAGPDPTGSDRITLFSTWFGTNLGHESVSQESQGARGPKLLLSVTEVSARLRVSRATVYKLVARGELAHLRVSGCIRIPGAALASYESREGKR
jgi:excisionase family DNA binding protein